MKDIIGPKIDWVRVTSCVQKKEETVSEYTEKFCQSAIAYSGIANSSENVLDDKGPLVRAWFDGLLSEYRSALPFLDLTWSNQTLRSNLDRLAAWERDSDVKVKVKIAAAALNNSNAEVKQEHKFHKREGTCNYCGKSGHWVKECRKKQQDIRRNLHHNPSPAQPAYNPEVVPPLSSETLGQIAQAFLRVQKEQKEQKN